MSIKDTILGTQPTSYWPLDDPGGSACHDAMGLHDASAPANGVALAVIPFGPSQAPYFDGALGSVLTIDDDPRYSQPYANALTVAAWVCPLALNNANTTGGTDQYVHYIEKAVGPSTDTEWAMRLYNQTNSSRHSRLSFYTFNLAAPLGQRNEGNGSYMEPGTSENDKTPIELGKWVFLVGQAEPWISPDDFSTGCVLWKQAVEAKRVRADKYAATSDRSAVRPEHGPGPMTVGGTQATGFKGSLAHIAVWNRLLSAAEIGSIWTAGASDLRGSAMYHSYP